jgi:adenylosuccinate synthase
VLDTFDEIRVCVAYEVNGRRLKSFPTDLSTLEKITLVYESFRGWNRPIENARSLADLPSEAREYLTAMARLTGTKLWLVSVGPRRDQTIAVE